MKFSIEVDCTPEEARAFLGLPDVKELQSSAMDLVQNRTAEYLKNMDAAALAKMWLPLGTDAMQAMQKVFMAQFQNPDTGKTKK